MFASGEALLLGRRDDLAVDDKSRRRVVEDGVYAEDLQRLFCDEKVISGLSGISAS